MAEALADLPQLQAALARGETCFSAVRALTRNDLVDPDNEAAWVAAIANKTVREVEEESGVKLDVRHLHLWARWITPEVEPKRFDARFFLAEAEALAAGGEDFAGAGGELRHLQWIDLPTARALPLPFITEVVLSEVAALLTEPGPRPVPFFHQRAEGWRYSLL